MITVDLLRVQFTKKESKSLQERILSGLFVNPEI
jgi:hypothetical protein